MGLPQDVQYSLKITGKSASTGEMAKRYGFIFVERYDDGTGDFSRRRKESFYWYKKVIETNGEDLD